MSDPILKASIEWDIPTWSKCLRHWEPHVDRLLQKNESLLGLELGGGKNGGVAYWLASKGLPTIFSSHKEISPRAIDFHSRVKGKITYRIIDATQRFGKPEFDVICFKSMLGGIRRLGHQEDQKVLQNCFFALKDDGLLLFAENLQGSFFHSMARKFFSTATRNNWHYYTEEEIIEMLKPSFSVDHKTYGFFSVFGFNGFTCWLFARMDSIFEPIIPSKFRYVISVVAKKVNSIQAE